MRSSLSIRLFALLAAGAIGIGRPVAAQGPPGKGAPPAPKVLVTPARSDTVAEPRAFVGTVKPTRRSVVGSAAAGRIEEFLVNEGDAVRAGQPVAQLRRGVIAAELAAAKGQLAVRQAELGELEKAYQEEYDQAQARLMHAQAVLAYRQAKVDRTRSLGSSVSKELFEEDMSFATQAQATTREAQAAVRMFTGGARQMKVEQSRAWVEAQKAEVQRLQEQFDRHTLYAPFDGWVAAEKTEVGQWVMQGDPAVEIVELKEVDVEIAVVEDFIANLHPGAVGLVEVPALPPERLPGGKLTGQVVIINPQADTRAHTFPVKVRVPNQIQNGEPLLKAGMFARVTLAVGKPTPCVLVPKDAVVLGGQSPLLFVAQAVAGKTTVKPVPVTLGPAQGTWIAAIGDIKEGEQVIVEGNERVRPGQEIRVEAKEVAYP